MDSSSKKRVRSSNWDEDEKVPGESVQELEPGASIEVIEVPRESVQAKPKAGNTVETPVFKNKPLKRFQIKMHTHSKNNSEDFERELFLLAKKSKRREFERAEEIHKKRMLIMDLEKEYWQKKINSI